MLVLNVFGPSIGMLQWMIYSQLRFVWRGGNRNLNGYFQGELTVISRAENSRKRAEMLQDMHYRSLIAFEKHLSSTFSPFRNISQRLVLLRRWESLIFSEPYCVKTIAERKRRPNISSRLNFKQAMVSLKSSPSWRIWWALPSVGCFERQPQCSSPSCSQVPMVQISSKRGRSTASSTSSW